MKTAIKTILIIITFFNTTIFSKNDTCRTFLISSARLDKLREEYVNNEIQSNPAYKLLIKEADQSLHMKPVSVTDKTVTPPSGSKHDYMSMGPYWWPNPKTKDRLPYIRRDGERNPEISKISDHRLEGRMVEAVNVLSAAYFLTRESRYSEKAVQLIRVWFLDKNTRMNPNLNYAQGIPGICTGRGIGIIETHNFADLIDDIGMLRVSSEWTKREDAGIKKWFAEYLNWLITSKYGKDEAGWKNNHGTWYAVQAASISLFLGKIKQAKNILNRAKVTRIGSRIESGGQQPLELARTKSWGYSVFNLSALFHLALLGDNVGIDLWHFQSPNGGSIRKALDFILPYALDMDKWKYKQIEKIDVNSLYPLLLIAEQKYDFKTYSNWIKKIFDGKEKRQTFNLFYGL